MKQQQSNYQALYSYAKENAQTRNLFQEYWQQDKRKTPIWQTQLSPELKCSAVATICSEELQITTLTAPNQSPNPYLALFEYGRQNAVHRDLFQDSTHMNMNMKNWQSSLKLEKSSQFPQNMVKKVA